MHDSACLLQLGSRAVEVVVEEPGDPNCHRLKYFTLKVWVKGWSFQHLLPIPRFESSYYSS